MNTLIQRRQTGKTHVHTFWMEVKLYDFSLLHSSLFGRRIYSSVYRKRNLDTKPATKCSTYILSCLQDMLGKWHHRTCRSDQHMSECNNTFIKMTFFKRKKLWQHIKINSFAIVSSLLLFRIIRGQFQDPDTNFIEATER